jgi:hypothetical protein
MCRLSVNSGRPKLLLTYEPVQAFVSTAFVSRLKPLIGRGGVWDLPSKRSNEYIIEMIFINVWAGIAQSV